MPEVRVPDVMNVELLVVDNGSTDHTSEVVERIRLLNMTLRSLHEPAPGLSVARNAGLRASTRDIVVFTDDDVRPTADWLSQLVEPITSGRADAVGGRVIIPKDRRVAWFAPLHRSWLASTERCENGPAELVGANMAFRREAWKSADAFDVHLGAGALGFGEDRLFSLRLQSDGCRIAFAPNAVVEHHFDLSRVNRAYFLSLAEKMGRSEAYLAYHWFNKADSWCGSMENSVPRGRNWARRILINLAGLLGRAGVTERELLAWTSHFFREQYRLELLQPRRYARGEPETFIPPACKAA
jgi:glycosyltransferase involved in cell wall biosynthesis